MSSSSHSSHTEVTTTNVVTDDSSGRRQSSSDYFTGTDSPLRSDLELHHTSYTHTDARIPTQTLHQHAGIPSSAGLAQEMVADGYQASAATLVCNSGSIFVSESPQLQEKRLKEQEEYLHAQEAIAHKYEKEIEKLTETYRRKTEAEAEKIRKELEKQHERDIIFREKLVEEAIERQKEEMALEAKFAKKELERQKLMAMDALERSRSEGASIHVDLNTIAGHTISESQKVLLQTQGSRGSIDESDGSRSLGSRIKETMLGKL